MGSAGICHRFVPFDANGRRYARPAEPATGPGRSPRGCSSGSFCFCGLGGGVVFWDALCPGFPRIPSLPGVFGLGAWLVLFHLGSLHCPGAVCAPPLARHTGLLEPSIGGRLPESPGGTGRACRLSPGGGFGRSLASSVVCSLLAWLFSLTADGGAKVSVSGRARDHCRVGILFARGPFYPAYVSICPVPFPGFAAQGVGRGGRMRSLLLGLPRIGRHGYSHKFYSLADRYWPVGVSADPLRLAGPGGAGLLLWSPVEYISSHDPNVLLVCGHQSGRDSAHGRDGTLRFLHFSRRTAGIRKRGIRRMSCI